MCYATGKFPCSSFCELEGCSFQDSDVMSLAERARQPLPQDWAENMARDLCAAGEAEYGPDYDPKKIIKKPVD